MPEQPTVERPTREPPTPFELRVDFSGVSLYVVDPGGKKVGFVMPDARYLGRRATHRDDTPAVPHVGYLRFDLANLASAASNVPIRDPAETPSYEVVHQFDRQTLDFGLPVSDEGIDTTNLALPNFDEFAPVLTLRRGLFAPEPPPEVVMHTVLGGGTLASIVDAGVEWELSGELHPQRRAIRRRFGGAVRWRRPVKDAAGLTLTFSRSPGATPTQVPLRPTTAPGDQPAIALKIGNLCANNPLEWRTFEPTTDIVPDTDFKWLYRLLELREGQDASYPRPVLPYPRPVASGNMTAVWDCFGGRITEAF